MYMRLRIWLHVSSCDCWLFSNQTKYATIVMREVKTDNNSGKDLWLLDLYLSKVVFYSYCISSNNNLCA